MEQFAIDKDIHVLCITATSFPDGVMAAHQKIHAIAPGRKYYGLSRPEKGEICYKAAAEELHDGEAEAKNCEPFTIPAGKYTGLDIKDFMKNIPSIGKSFQQILQAPNIDPNGYCVEWSFNDTDVRCMVRIIN